MTVDRVTAEPDRMMAEPDRVTQLVAVRRAGGRTESGG